ncbi:MAG TPA: FumA C-terminus/TtdB family hydratase beta subunit [Syntrophales bacterium]|nr:FumA C-terminus/TtdB family hydratase beta subunit [Syntrophales bacterium]HOM08060.1 FumA C-terminus/TtdB family hydratase beta subunit [Syntrophales bacterium]HON99816.1 FumA C-terminus/TtdB family hydratase beta subunit [Syntrophales bacterium]HPC01467.1 FumA C-terminus/TtdB family hydratase beta subunit [Syntrophales bacterium]HPQ07469.1 FumA C-terminus/TtdB family hydratase beta subunit [Syntrophales bacterium]
MRPVIEIATPLTAAACRSLRAGDRVSLSGDVITARDTAHRLLCEALARGEGLPFPAEGAVIFYAGPCPAPPGFIIGAVGPTTSYRMDPFTVPLLKAGVRGMIGKGKRSAAVREAIKEHSAVYLAALGGIAALLSRCVTQNEILAYPDLGPEAVRRLTVRNLPLVVVNDPWGNDLYEQVLSR